MFEGNRVLINATNGATSFVCMPKITVIIPTFNRERYVQRAIDSVLNQSFKDYELVVVDDGSTDNTRPALQHYGTRIRYIYQTNQGVSAARNTGIEAATGEWVAFLDSDDEWMTDYLACQMERADADSTICMQSTDAWVVELEGERHRYFDNNRSRLEFNGRDYLLKTEPFSFILQHQPWQLGSTIVRRTALRTAGGFDVSLTLSEDLDLMARVGLHGSFGLIRRELVNVYRRKESIDSLTIQAKKRPIESRRSDERIYEKLGNLATLTARERKVLRGVISANKRAIGNLLLEQGDVHGAKHWYARAVAACPSIKSLGKYILFVASHGIRASLAPSSGEPSAH